MVTLITVSLRVGKYSPFSISSSAFVGHLVHGLKLPGSTILTGAGALLPQEGKEHSYPRRGSVAAGLLVGLLPLLYVAKEGLLPVCTEHHARPLVDGSEH